MREHAAGAGNRGVSPQRRARVALAALALAFAAFLLAAPARAYADGYSVDEVSMSATVRKDGSLSVVERRTFSFDGEVNGVYWTIPHAENQQGAASGVEVDDVACTDGADKGAFRRVAVAEKGESGVYTVEDDGASTTIMVFSPQDDSTATFQVSYTLDGAVMAWADTGELYWQFVGPDWEEASEDVSLNVRFEGAPAGLAGADVRAWGHGPLEGTVEVGGASVSYRMPEVAPGEFAEARVVFPRGWVPGLAASPKARLQTVLDEEAAWAEEANARRERARTALAVLRAACMGGSAVFAAGAWVFRWRRRASQRPRFAETYFRDVPSNDHPAVIAAFCRKGKVEDEAFVATLMKLTDDGVISIDGGAPGDGKPRRGDASYALVLKDPGALERLRAAGSRQGADAAGAEAFSARIDAAAIELFFRDGSATAGFDDMERFSDRRPERYRDLLESFRCEVSATLEARNLVASSGKGALVAGTVLGTCLSVAGVVGGLLLDDPLTALVPIVLAVLGVWGLSGVERLTPEGVELRARCNALRRWLEDFTRLD